jgi:hypothetical protein
MGERGGGREGGSGQGKHRHHLVSKDPVDAIVVEFDHPIEPFQLVGTHDSADDRLGLREEAGHAAGGKRGRWRRMVSVSP